MRYAKSFAWSSSAGRSRLCPRVLLAHLPPISRLSSGFATPCLGCTIGCVGGRSLVYHLQAGRQCVVGGSACRNATAFSPARTTRTYHAM